MEEKRSLGQLILEKRYAIVDCPSCGETLNFDGESFDHSCSGNGYTIKELKDFYEGKLKKDDGGCIT